MPCQKLFLALILTGLLAASAPAADIAALIQQLDADKFSDRNSATERLSDLGAAAIPALKEAANSSSREVAMRAFSILQAHLEDGDAETHKLAKAALDELSTGEDRVARQAKAALQPKPDPNQAARLLPPGRIMIGAPAVARIQIRQGGNGRRVQVRVVNGVKEITVEENGQKVQIREDPNNGIRVEVTEKKDGKETTNKYEAKDVAELKKKHPDAFKVYEKHIKQNGGIQIQAARPAVPQPQRIAQIRKDHFDRVKKTLDDKIQRYEKQAEQADDLQKEHYKRIVESLKRHRKMIEEMEARQLPAQDAPQNNENGRNREDTNQQRPNSEQPSDL